MPNLSEIIHIIFSNAILLITLIIIAVYISLAIISAFTLKTYLNKNSYVDYDSILLSPLAPGVSMISPAFNEQMNIVDNVHALLSVYYKNYEVIIVNDGSTDNTLNELINAFELQKITYAFDYHLPCERIRGIYKSTNQQYGRLLIIDKLNGGKSDSLNAGINVAKNELLVSIDADSILVPDALLKLVKPFLEETDRKVIGTGGVLRIANSCVIENGIIKEVNLPKQFLPRIQVLEYTRAFLMSRMAWSRLDGLLIISGALGMFDRKVVIECGGYDTKTVGEDMELVVRMRRYMTKKKEKYAVQYIPDPLCFTEVPSSIKVLGRQRKRWTRGTIETLLKHRKIFMNPRYKTFGMLGYTYWLIFEWLGPLIEFFGITYFIIMAILGNINWPFFLLLLGFVYTFAVSLSIWAVLFEEMTFHKYEKRRDVIKLIFTAFLEPFFYHPLTTFWSVSANINYLFGQKGHKTWGKMDRKGFDHNNHKKN